MGGKGGKAPSAPDPEQTAAAQAKYGKETAIWNSALQNVNQITPYGNLSWTLGTATPTGGAPVYDMAAYNAAMSAYGAGGSGLSPTAKFYETMAFGNSHEKDRLIQMQDQYQRKLMTPEQLTATPYFSSGGVGGAGGKAPQLSDFKTGGGTNQFGELPQWTSRIELSPEMQVIFDSQMRQQKRLGGLAENALGQVEQAYATPYSYSNINPLYGADDLNAARMRTEEALYSRLNPQFARDEEALRSRLINQGIGQNSEAYNREMERFNQMKNDARMQAILAGGTEADRLFSQSMAARQQGITEMDRLRAQPLNEYLAMSGQQQLQNPQFQNYSYQGAPTPDYQGLVAQKYQADLANYNAKQQASNSMTSALFGLGGQLGASFLGSSAGSSWLASMLPAAAAASDANVKENIEFIGERNGFPVYDFNYKGGKTRYRGVMAQDVEKIMPEAVSDIDGVLHVNYDMIGFPMERVNG